jgi:hypothetical protein
MTNEFYNELLRKFIMKKLEKEINDEVWFIWFRN